MIKKVVATAAVTGSLMMAGAGLAVADSGADAKAAAVGSPGVISGNNVQVPIGIPINLCGNTINIIALLNPAFGNTCVNA
ncbi:chaplin [Streptomyces specialis]|uniref:chaplin n=1 Tax=Streptomyces specialis TaxID=498367 RepID=UPI00073E847C|nr:chaplin [Streptomyces specialis]